MKLDPLLEHCGFGMPKNGKIDIESKYPYSKYNFAISTMDKVIYTQYIDMLGGFLLFVWRPLNPLPLHYFNKN